MTKPQPHRRPPNISATLEGEATSPRMRLRSIDPATVTFAVDVLTAALSRIDDGLEVVATDDPTLIYVQPKPGVVRTRAGLFIETKKLMRTQSGLRVRWND